MHGSCSSNGDYRLHLNRSFGSSDFEFDVSCDEPPVSPRLVEPVFLLTAFSPHWNGADQALLSSMALNPSRIQNEMRAAPTDYYGDVGSVGGAAAVVEQAQHEHQLLDEENSTGLGLTDKSQLADQSSESLIATRSDHPSITFHQMRLNIGQLDASGESLSRGSNRHLDLANGHQQVEVGDGDQPKQQQQQGLMTMKRRENLRSLMQVETRESKQLNPPALVADSAAQPEIQQSKVIEGAVDFSSLLLRDLPSHSSSSCSCISTGSGSPPVASPSPCDRPKCRRWSSRLQHLLKKVCPMQHEPHHNRQCVSHKSIDESQRGHQISHQLIDEHLEDCQLSYPLRSDYHNVQRIKHRIGNESLTDYSVDSPSHTGNPAGVTLRTLERSSPKGAMLDGLSHTDHGNIDYARQLEFPTQCTACGQGGCAMLKRELIIKRDSGMTRGEPNQGKNRASAPVSPIRGSPARNADNASLGAISMGSTYTSWSRPAPILQMSPHAQHYQQQRARAEDLKKRTFLPYRQSLLLGGAFLFHSTAPPALTMTTSH